MDEDIGFILESKKTGNIEVLTSKGGLNSSSGREDKGKIFRQFRRIDRTLGRFLIDREWIITILF